MRRCFRRSAGRYTRWAPRWPDGRFPQGVSCPLGKASILLRKSPTVQICWSFFISSPLLSPRQKLPPGENFNLASNSTNNLIRWRFFISSLLLSPRQKLPPGENFNLASNSTNNLIRWRFFISSPLLSPRRRLSSGGKAHRYKKAGQAEGI